MTAFNLALLFLTGLASVNTRSVDTTGMKNVLLGVEETEMGNMCQDCTQIFELLKDLVSNQDFQAKLIATLEQVCDQLPAQVTQICHNEVEKFLPLAITFVSSIMNPNDICKYLGLCGGHDSGNIKDLLLNHMAKTVPMSTLTMETSIQCSVCSYIVSTLSFLFPRERAQSVITLLLESLCKEFPSLVQPQCIKLVDRYVQLLMDMLLNNTSPNFICSLLRMCEIRDHPINAPALSECDSCLTLAVLSRMHLGSNTTEQQASSFLERFCHLHPSAVPECEAYMQRHGNQLRAFLSKQQGALDICKSVNLCVSGEKEPVVAADPCTLGPIYSCKDLQTAVDCGAVSFCEKNVWA